MVPVCPPNGYSSDKERDGEEGEGSISSSEHLQDSE